MEINLTGCTSSSYHYPSLSDLLQDFAVQRPAGTVFSVGQVPCNTRVKRGVLGHLVCYVPVFVNLHIKTLIVDVPNPVMVPREAETSVRRRIPRVPRENYIKRLVYLWTISGFFTFNIK